MQKLLLETLESYYWLGFLLADGHFGKSALTVNLAIKDNDHLIKLADFLGFPEKVFYKNVKLDGKVYSQVAMSLNDKRGVKKIKDKFAISERKTYIPPNLESIEDDLFLSLFVGFIDGDGSIRKQSQKDRKDCFITIKLHRSWFKVLEKMSLLVSDMSNAPYNPPHLNKSGYVVLNLSNRIAIRFLKKKVEEWNLPVLRRKWDRINEDALVPSRVEIAAKRRKKILKMLDEGTSAIDIARQLNVCCATITKAVKSAGFKTVADYLQNNQ